MTGYEDIDPWAVVGSAIGNAAMSDLPVRMLLIAIQTSDNPAEFDVSVDAAIRLFDIMEDVAMPADLPTETYSEICAYFAKLEVDPHDYTAMIFKVRDALDGEDAFYAEISCHAEGELFFVTDLWEDGGKLEEALQAAGVSPVHWKD